MNYVVTYVDTNIRKIETSGKYIVHIDGLTRVCDTEEEAIAIRDELAQKRYEKRLDKYKENVDYPYNVLKALGYDTIENIEYVVEHFTENIQEAFKIVNLKERQINIFTNYFMNGKPYILIGKDYNVSKQCINNEMKVILHKLRTSSEVDTLIKYGKDFLKDLKTRDELIDELKAEIENIKQDLRRIKQTKEFTKEDEIKYNVVNLYAKPLTAFKLSARTINALEIIGVTNIKELCNKINEVSDIYRIKRIGKKSAAEIIDFMNEKMLWNN